MALKLNRPYAPSILIMELINLKYKPYPKSNSVYNK